MTETAAGPAVSVGTGTGLTSTPFTGLRGVITTVSRSQGSIAQGMRFACVGATSFVVNLGLFAALHAPLGGQLSNVVSLLLATLGNTELNRRWTFGVTGPRSASRQHAQSLLVFGVAWALSAGALALLPLLWAHPTTLQSTTAVAASMVASTALRFVAMRRWIFRPAT